MERVRSLASALLLASIFWSFSAPADKATVNSGASEQAGVAMQRVPWLLTWEQVQELPKSFQLGYFKSLQNILLVTEKYQKRQATARVEPNWFWNVLIPIADANGYAQSEFLCIGGGVPDRTANDQNCGTSEYAGFSCSQTTSSGQRFEICNPLVFGVRSSGQPICFPNATTKTCFDNIRTGTDSTFEPVFEKANARRDYSAFAREINTICRDPGSAIILEARSEVVEACNLVRRQFVLNHVRNLYAGTFVPRPSDLPDATEGEHCEGCDAEDRVGREAEELRRAATQGVTGGQSVPNASIQTYGQEFAVEFNLARLNPSDIGDYCPRYPSMNSADRNQFWVTFLYGIASVENRTFDPSLPFRENFGTGYNCVFRSENPRVISRGLLQVSACSCRDNYGLSISSPEQLHNSRMNIECGARILNQQIGRHGSIRARRVDCHPRQSARAWCGASSYFSTVRSQSHNREIKGQIRRHMPGCF
ncbi:MAG: hypothetical protein HRT45_07990 [Bdellovibrionales bacterium]|nr:hypothetical protein [Bdellovibrionales bacterium]